MSRLNVRGLDPEYGNDGDVIKVRVRPDGRKRFVIAPPVVKGTTTAAATLTVQDSTVDVDTAVTVLNFEGATVTPDAAGQVTVTITPAAGGSSGEVLMQDGTTAPPVPIETEGRDDWLYQG